MSLKKNRTWVFINLVLLLGLFIPVQSVAGEDGQEEHEAAAGADRVSAGMPAGALELGAESDPGEKQKRSESIVVTATRTERTADEVPASVTVVPREVIQAAPARTMDEVLRTVTGLNMGLQTSLFVFPTNSTVSMRGLGPGRALVLLDGVPLNDPAQGYIQWNKLNMPTVDRVEIVRGALASLFGNYAMGGAVNIVTQPISETAAEGEISYGTLNTWHGTAGFTTRLSPTVGVGFWVDALSTDGYVKPIPEARGKVDVPAYAKPVNLQAKVEWREGSGAKAFLKTNYLYHDMSQGTPLAFVVRRIFDTVLGGMLPIGRAELSGRVFYQQEGFHYTTSLFVPGTGRDQEYLNSIVERPGSVIGGSLLWSCTYGTTVPSVSAGIDIQQVVFGEDSTFFNQTGSVTSARETRGLQTSGGIFAQASFFPAPQLEILASSRLDLFKNHAGRQQVTPGEVTLYPERNSTKFDPRLSLRFGVSRSIALRAAGYAAFRAPLLSDLYKSSVSRTQIVLPNPDLMPESLVGGDAGVDLNRGKLTAQLNVFYNEVTDLLTRVTLATSPVVILQATNVGASRSYGLEVMTSFPLAPSLTADAGYTLTDAAVTKNPRDPRVEGMRVPDVSRHSGSLTLRFQARSGVTALARARFLSNRYTDATNTLELPGHAVADASISVPLSTDFNVFTSIENLFNRHYLNDVALGPRLAPPFQIFAGVRLRHSFSKSTRQM